MSAFSPAQRSPNRLVSYADKTLFSDEALKMVLAEPDLDHDPCFRMPQLGQHYAQKKGNWEREQEQEQLVKSALP